MLWLTRPSTLDPRPWRRRGAVAAEMALLGLFVYVPLIIGALYISWLAVGRQRVHEVNHYAVWGEGDQSEELAARGEMEAEYFREFTGQIEVVERTGDEPYVPGPDELRDMWEEFQKPIHFRNVSARGSFRLEGNVVIYTWSYQINEGWRVRPEGRTVQNWNLLADEIPERVTDLLQEWMTRRKARSFYEHRWVHDRDEVVAGGRGVAGWNLRVPVNATQDPWTPETAIRGDKLRTARSEAPPGTTVRRQIGTPLALPEPDPRGADFWHACDPQDPGTPGGSTGGSGGGVAQ